jgi:hypothetical protein
MNGWGFFFAKERRKKLSFCRKKGFFLGKRIKEGL